MRKTTIKLSKLRKLIREAIKDSDCACEGTGCEDNVHRDDDELLLEPDSAKDSDDDVDEMNAVAAGGVSGVTTPLGTDSTGRSRKKKK